MGADDLKTSLDGVSVAKVIDPDELARAKELRDVIDVLKGKVEDLSLSIGESLVPVLGDLGGVIEVGLDVRNIFKSIPGATWMSENLTPLALTKTALGGVKDAAGFVFDLFKDEKEVLPIFAENMTLARQDTDTFKESIKQAREDGLMPLKTTLNDTWKEIKNVDEEWRILIGSLETDVAIDNARTSLDELGTAAAEAFTTGSTEDIAAYREQLLLATTDIMNLALDMDDISSHKVKVLVDKGDLEGALILIEKIKAFQKTYANVSDPFAAMAGAANIDLSGLQFRANGGPVSQGGSYIVGERGPELFTPGTSGNITPNSAMGGGNITINVTSANPDDVVTALQRWVRNNGSLALATTAGVRF
jgi:hypothetical protein